MAADAELTKDVLQSFFLEMWERRNRLGEVKDMGAYLHTSFHRKLLRELKARRTTIHLPDEKLNTESSPSWEALLIQSQEKKEEKEQLQNALNDLPSEQKRMLHFRFFEEMSYDDIAEKTGKSRQTIYNQVHDAIRKLRKILGCFW